MMSSSNNRPQRLRATMALAALAVVLMSVVALVLPTIAAARGVTQPAAANAPIGEIAADALPAEARATLALIKSGGPFPYRKDGVVFGNRERRLPARPRGHYQEYTVKTPGSRDRGARRIVAGKGDTGSTRTSGEYYYTDDHYETFRRIRESEPAP